jgi:hypothetical protein
MNVDQIIRAQLSQTCYLYRKLMMIRSSSFWYTVTKVFWLNVYLTGLQNRIENVIKHYLKLMYLLASVMLLKIQIL